MKLIFKDKGLEEDLAYYIFSLATGYRGINRNPLFGTPPTPFFEATFRFAYHNVEENQKFLKLLHVLALSGHYIDEIIIEKEVEQDSLYEKIYIKSYNQGIKRNPHTWEYKVFFEALKVSPILTPEEARVIEVLLLIQNDELWIGRKK